MKAPAGARACAFQVLRGVELGRGFGKDLLDDPAALAGLDRRDAALVRELVYGVERHRRTLKHLLRGLSHVAVEKINPPVRIQLYLGLYQLLFLEKVPPHAAVAETVELARGKATRGFVNAILRAAARLVESRGTGEPPPGVPPTRVLPTRPGAHLVLADPVLPDPVADPVRAHGVRHSYPDELVARWLARLGPEPTRAALEAGNEVPPLFLRANRRRIARDALAARLRQEGVETEPAATPDGLRVAAGAHAHPAELESFREGLFTVQDETAQRAVLALDPQPGERILDLCAAPGGKATQIAEALGERGEVVAVDVAPDRLALVEESARRLGLAGVRTVAADVLAPGATGSLAAPGPFDRVLADVPCSNTGVLRRRVEARWRFRPADLDGLTTLQQRLLGAAADAVRPGGLVVYSTCSVEDEEDRGLVDRFLADPRGAGFTLEGDERILPRPGGGDGGYIARLRRLAPA